MVQIPEDLFKQVLALLMELPAKHTYVLLKRLEAEHVKDAPSPPTAPPPE